MVSEVEKKEIYKRPYIRDAYSKRVSVKARNSGESKTHQSFKDECDINNIVKRYARGEKIPEAQGTPHYIESPIRMDLHAALNVSKQVQQLYESQTTPNQRSEYGSNAFAWLADQISEETEQKSEKRQNGDSIPAAAENRETVDTVSDAQKRDSVDS